jgi:signal transduction histidine kinase
MPSLAAIGTMERQLADIRFALEQSAVGYRVADAALGEHVRELGEARWTYESLPQFAGEAEVWARARPMIADVPRLVGLVLADVRVGALARAEERVQREFGPAEAIADAALIELRQLNLEQGTIAARRADGAWSRARAVAIALDVACALLTAALAILALRSARRSVEVEARRADELDAFAARVAHDIRGPLTPPLVALQAIAREPDGDSPRQRMVERGLRGLQHADTLVRDLLLFARAAATPGAETHAMLPEVIAGVVQDLEGQAAAAGVHMEVGELPVAEVCCAPGVLSSIVGNLVGNALKYMPPGARTRLVSVRATQAAESVHLEVSDTGAGVPAGELERIFEPYVRADARHPGLGLGLATVKRLVLAHRGRLGVHSRTGEGSVFWVELPARAA